MLNNEQGICGLHIFFIIVMIVAVVILGPMLSKLTGFPLWVIAVIWIGAGNRL